MSADHAAEARQNIEWAHEWQGREGSHDATEIAGALIAQAEATLAVADQIRASNLIAILANGQSGVLAGVHGRDEYLALHARLNPEIARLLGIGDSDEY